MVNLIKDFLRLWMFVFLTTFSIYIFYAEVSIAENNEFDAVLNVMAYGREVSVKINGVHINQITGGKYQGVRLFLANAPEAESLPAQFKELFCLKEGENTIEISFKAKEPEESPSPLTVSIDSINYKVPVVKYTQEPGIKEGNVKGIFKLYSEEPAGFTTIILKQ